MILKSLQDICWLRLYHVNLSPFRLTGRKGGYTSHANLPRPLPPISDDIILTFPVLLTFDEQMSVTNNYQCPFFV